MLDLCDSSCSQAHSLLFKIVLNEYYVFVFSMAEKCYSNIFKKICNNAVLMLGWFLWCCLQKTNLSLNAEGQVIKTNQQNILIRALTLRKQRGESSSKTAKGVAAGEGSSRKRYLYYFFVMFQFVLASLEWSCFVCYQLKFSQSMQWPSMPMHALIELLGFSGQI